MKKEFSFGNVFKLHDLCSMGLHCSKQGYIKDFHDCDDKRLGPEGESFPETNYVSKQYRELVSKLNVSTMPQDVTEILNLQSIARTSAIHSPKMNMEEKRQNVIIGEESDCSLKDTPMDEKAIVNLPPEGNVDPHKEFVELPSSKKNDQDYVIELRKDDTNSVCVETVDLPPKLDSLMPLLEDEPHACQTPDLKDEKAVNEHSTTTAENNWTYTLYDFQGNGLVTKQDLQQLMDSICLVVDQSVCAVPKPESKSHSLKVHLEIGRDNNKMSVRSTSKYTPSKHYKGMIFPPPNSEEAEKVSTYIEEKLSTVHRDRLSRKVLNCREYKKRNEIKDKTSAINNQCLLGNSHHVSESFYAIPKRQGLCYGMEHVHADHTSNIAKKCTYNRHNKREASSSNSPSSLSVSGANTPRRIGGNDEEKACFNESKTKCKTQQDETNKIRLHHSCLCHQKIKNKLKPYESSAKVDQESNLCKQIKTSARKHFSDYDYDRQSFNSSSPRSSSSSGSGISSKHDPCKYRTPSRHKHSSTRSHIHKPLSKKNSHEMPESSSQRPAVWPGESIRVDTPEQTKITSSCFPNSDIATDQLCFCKRMLGLDYPCDHSSTVHHTHKHEHHHYHYYVPHSTSTH